MRITSSHVLFGRSFGDKKKIRNFALKEQTKKAEG